MVTLEKITKVNFYEIIKMKLPDDQDQYVAENVYSLAQAWLYPEEARPVAVCNDGKVVGFLMLSWDERERGVGVWRFMIAHEEQGKGYGRKAMEAVIAMAKNAQNIDFMFLDYVEGNTVAQKLYYSLGFRETGKIEEGEIVMKMELTDKPKIALLTADESDAEEIETLLRAANAQGKVFSPSLCDKQNLCQLLKEGQVTRIALYGETIGIKWQNERVIDQKYESRTGEIESALDAVQTK